MGQEFYAISKYLTDSCTNNLVGSKMHCQIFTVMGCCSLCTSYMPDGKRKRLMMQCINCGRPTEQETFCFHHFYFHFKTKNNDVNTTKYNIYVTGYKQAFLGIR